MQRIVRMAVLAAMLVFASAAAGGAQAPAGSIAVIGTGEVAAALGPRFAELGYRVVYGSREPSRADVADLVARTGSGATAALPAEAVREAQIVLMAVPWDAVEQVAAEWDGLEGRIIIDPTNPRIEAEDGYRDFAFAEGSNAERIQALVPGAHVVKAFNTLGSTLMADPARAQGPVTVPIVGDDPEAKRVVAELVAALGLHPADVGPLRHARVVEGLHYLRINAARGGHGLFEYHFR